MGHGVPPKRTLLLGKEVAAQGGEGAARPGTTGYSDGSAVADDGVLGTWALANSRVGRKEMEEKKLVDTFGPTEMGSGREKIGTTKITAIIDSLLECVFFFLRYQNIG